MAEDIIKLPKWAQWRIQNLEQEIAAKRAAMDAYAGQSTTNIKIDPDASSLRTGDYPRYIPDRTSVEYTLKHGEIEVDLRSGVLRITANGRGQLIVEPVASNALELHLIVSPSERSDEPKSS